MRICRKTWVMAILVALCLPAFAQEDVDDMDDMMREAERRLFERESEMADAAREMAQAHAERARLIRDENVEVEIRMREAEAALAEAAQQVAELSRHSLPRVATIERIIRSGHGPMLGITIGSDDNDEPVEGVTILGVSPGGAAEEAGLRAGDVITAMNGETLTADNDSNANKMLLDFMQGVEEGDDLEVEFLRNGKSQTAELSPRPMQGSMFAFDFDGNDFTVPNVQVAPHMPSFNRFMWMSGGSGLGDMELVKLTERLGSYFGTDEGLLIVRAPKNEELKLQDGDVIRNIDGREPTSVNHAMRILGSYQSGETVKIEIMRDKRKQTISIEIPDSRQSFVPNAVPPIQAVPAVNIVRAPGACKGSDLC